MTNQVTANTPQEARLLLLFRQTSLEERDILMELTGSFAENHRASKPHLRLIVNEKRRATDTKASA